MRRTATGLLTWALLAGAWIVPPLAAQGWVTQTYEVSAQIETDAETMAHPEARVLRLVLSADVPAAEICADSSTSSVAGRTRVRVFINPGGDGPSGEREPIEFAWRRLSGNFDDQCEAVGALAAGDLVEYRFAFFDMPPLEIRRRGRRIAGLPSLRVTGWVQTVRAPE